LLCEAVQAWWREGSRKRCKEVRRKRAARQVAGSEVKVCVALVAGVGEAAERKGGRVSGIRVPWWEAVGGGRQACGSAEGPGACV